MQASSRSLSADRNLRQFPGRWFRPSAELLQSPRVPGSNTIAVSCRFSLRISKQPRNTVQNTCSNVRWRPFFSSSSWGVPPPVHVLLLLSSGPSFWPGTLPTTVIYTARWAPGVRTRPFRSRAGSARPAASERTRGSFFKSSLPTWNRPACLTLCYTFRGF